MEKKNVAVIIDGKKYEYLKSKYDVASMTCRDCALKEMCDEYEEGILCGALGVDRDYSSNFQLVDEPEQPEEKIEPLTEEDVYDYYQERSVTAGNRADQLAWVFVIMMTGGLVSGHAFETFSVCAALSAVYMFFSIMQAVWQTFTSWLFMQRIKDSDDMFADYPSWVGGGAWLFFWLKMIAISAAVVYFVSAIVL